MILIYARKALVKEKYDERIKEEEKKWEKRASSYNFKMRMVSNYSLE